MSDKVSARSYRAPLNQETFDLTKGFNINCLRVWVTMAAAEPAKGQWNQDFFDRLGTLIDLAEENRIYLIIDMHLWRLCHKDLGAGPGMGVPDWLVAGANNFVEAWAIVYSDYGIQQIGDCWRRIAEVCKGHNVVMGYDIFDEPPAGRHPQGWGRSKTFL